MERLIRRSIIAGKIRAPASVAAPHRILFACSVAVGQTVVSNLPPSPNIDATISACNAFGADIVTEGTVADVFGAEEIFPPPILACGASNTTLKLFISLCSLFDKEVELSGSGQLGKKPIEPYVGYLERLGATCFTPSGFLPVRIKGPISVEQMVYPSQLGTQFLSGLLLCAPLRMDDTEIGIEGQMPGWEYVGQTIGVMKKCGISFSSEGSDFLYVQGGQEYAPPGEIEVPPSSYLSSFLLLAGAVAGRIEVEGMPPDPALEKLLTSFGAEAHSRNGNFLSSAGSLSSASLSAPELGRLLPHALVLASLAAGETSIKNMGSLGRSEGARMRIVMRELSKMGASFTDKGGELLVKGGRLAGAEINAEGNAAAAMALSVAALAAGGQAKIIGAECVSDSYHGFFRDLASLGAIIR
ncbi:TPA: hypothetical protein HA225_01340 [Candidatus Micrarchaeota archaeon]|nr:hypothetical protein [Candidatus Micrarchaeota archaeon]